MYNNDPPACTASYLCPRPPLNLSALFPHSLRLQLDEVQSDLKDPRRFGDALAILQTQDFQKKDIKRVFNAYSDNIYYLVSGKGGPIGPVSVGLCRHRVAPLARAALFCPPPEKRIARAVLIGELCFFQIFSICDVCIKILHKAFCRSQLWILTEVKIPRTPIIHVFGNKNHENLEETKKLRETKLEIWKCRPKKIFENNCPCGWRWQG